MTARICPTGTRRSLYCLCAAVFSFAIAGCDSTPRADARRVALPVESPQTVQTSELQAGPPVALPTVRNPYEGDKRAIEEGRRYFADMNCHGCHGAAGGGGIGPPFVDAEWIYGSQPQNIYQSIVQGRPNGMPSYRGRIPEDRLWMIISYITSLSAGNAPTAGSAGSTDSAAQSGDRMSGARR